MTYVMLSDLYIILFFISHVIKSFKKTFINYFIISYIIVYNIIIIPHSLNKVNDFIEFGVIKH